MAFWLVKTEPNTYSIEDLKRDGQTEWEGVRNYQARNYMREMKKGDKALFYHSNANPPAIVGVAEVVKAAYPDATQFDPKSKYYDAKSDQSNPRWDLVDLKFVSQFASPMSLETAKSIGVLKEMVLVKRGRLSVQPVMQKEWDYILSQCNQ